MNYAPKEGRRRLEFIAKKLGGFAEREHDAIPEERLHVAGEALSFVTSEVIAALNRLDTLQDKFNTLQSRCN